MSTGTWVLWALFLLAQNASFTWVSRARNSGSYTYHAAAAVASNAIWFAQMLFAVNVLTTILTTRSVLFTAAGVLFYTFWTVVGSVATHWFLKTHVERGRLRVGA
jgi:hypothetical protein